MRAWFEFEIWLEKLWFRLQGLDPDEEFQLRKKEALSFEGVLAQELSAVEESRRHRLKEADLDGARPAGPVAYRALHSGLVGVSFSGGGIRSATFNLGILQGLAKHKLLPSIDYLSTVSGGGYIASWLQAWIFRRESVADVEKELRDSLPPQDRRQRTPGRQMMPDEGAPRIHLEPHPVSWLRRYSNYLTPVLGLFNADTWTVVSIWLRNTFLNQLVMLMVLGALLLAPRLLHNILLGNPSHEADPDPFDRVLLAALFLAIGTVFIGRNLEPMRKSEEKKPARYRENFGLQLMVILPLLAASFFTASSIVLLVTGPSSAVRRVWASAAFGCVIFGLLMALSRKSRGFGVPYWRRGPNASGREPEGSWIPVPRKISYFLISAAPSVGMAIVYTWQKENVWPWQLIAAVAVYCLGLAALLFYPFSNESEETGVGVAEPLDPYREVMYVLMHLACTAAAAGFLYLVLDFLHSNPVQQGELRWHAMVWGAPMIVSLFSIAIVLQIGLLGREMFDARREWWSRLGAFMMIYTLGWIGWQAAAIYGPFAVAWSVTKLQSVWTTGVLATWVATVAAGVLSGGSRATGNPRESKGVKEVALNVLAVLAPWLFILGAILLISFALQWLLLQTHPYQPGDDGGGISWSTPQIVAAPFLLLSEIPLSETAVAFVLALVAALVLAWRIDINEFSMHQFYKNRLVRCYMGASRPVAPASGQVADGDPEPRMPNPFTGFDIDDDLPVKCMAVMSGNTPPRPYTYGPYSIVNTSLNLVHGRNLAWQERKAASFFFSPLYSGYDVNIGDSTHRLPSDRQSLCRYAFRSTTDYAYRKDGIWIGRAMAISGAAASPNSGYHSSPQAAILMTVFNVRLGAWIGNTRHRDGYRFNGPKSGFFYLLAELLSLTNDESKYVYLSDGGHFENLGIYELVHRRCRYIVACDSEQDCDFRFEGLANAIRKCRTDFGVSIEIDTTPLKPDPASRLSTAHCVVGRIHYPEDQEATGTLVYIKASVTGDEPADTIQYRAVNPDFPHQSTADQWFNESQFESYRALGFHVADTVFSAVDASLSRVSGREAFFRELRQQWSPSNPLVERHFTRHSAHLMSLMEQLRTDADLQFLCGQITPEWEALMRDAQAEPRGQGWLPRRYAERRAGFFFCNSLIQLMENVYLDLVMECNYAHPDNRGWMNLFHHWAWSSMFRVAWAISAPCYGARFQSFCEGLFELNKENRAWIDCIEIKRDAMNFIEREHYSVVESGDKLYQLEMCVRNPDGIDTFSFPFGFAVVDGSKALVYYRIRNHLRKMGLWSRTRQKMLDKGLFEATNIRAMKDRPTS